MSPRWLIYALPVLLLPVAAILLLEDERTLSQVEVALGALPLAGEVPTSAEGRQGAQLLGATQQMPPSVSSSLYANSAQSEAARFAARVLGPGQPGQNPAGEDEAELRDYGSIIYDALHPQQGPAQDMLAGGYNAFERPFGYDLSRLVFREFCMASSRAGDPEAEAIESAAPPLSPELLGSIASFIPLTDMARMCPRLRT